MSELKDLVPPLELCNKIPAGSFADSALVWCRRTSRFAPHELVIQRETADPDIAIPAPTLAEIMTALDEAGYIFTDVFKENSPTWCAEVGTVREHYHTYISDENATVAALKLWLEVEVKND